MADWKYSLNGIDLEDTKGWANDSKPRWFLDMGTQMPEPGAMRDSSCETSQDGLWAPERPLFEPGYARVAITVTEYGVSGSTYEDDLIRNFRENSQYVEALLYERRRPLLRYFPWLPSNVAIPENSTSGANAFYFDADAELISINKKRVGDYRLTFECLFRLPQGMTSRWVATTFDPVDTGVTIDGFAYPWGATEKGKAGSYRPTEEHILLYDRYNPENTNPIEPAYLKIALKPTSSNTVVLEKQTVNANALVHSFAEEWQLEVTDPELKVSATVPLLTSTAESSETAYKKWVATINAVYKPSGKLLLNNLSSSLKVKIGDNVAVGLITSESTPDWYDEQPGVVILLTRSRLL